MKNSIENAIDLIKTNDNIFIVSHISPDGDNMGSSLALMWALEKKNKNVTVLESDLIPDDFKFLPGSDSIKPYNENLGDIDLLIALDCGDEERLGLNKELLERSNKVLNIDHHVSNTNFGDVNVVDPDASATGELVYELVKAMDISIDKNIAENLYTAISTDTGSFKYDSTTSKTHRIVAELLDTGIDKNKININIYENMSFSKMNLLREAFKTLETFKGKRIATMEVTQDMLSETETSMEDAEGIISFIRNLDTVEVAVLLKERKEKSIKVSLRTKKDVDASKICKIFGGGGHKRAAGCTINEELNRAKELIVKAIEKEMEL